jgi:hypothetical protein
MTRIDRAAVMDDGATNRCCSRALGGRTEGAPVGRIQLSLRQQSNVLSARFPPTSCRKRGAMFLKAYGCHVCIIL